MNRFPSTPAFAWATPLVAAALLAGGCTPAAGTASSQGAAAPAAGAEDAAASAKTFVTTLYARYESDDFNPLVQRDGVWDPAMLALMTRVDAAQEAGDGAIFDFEPLCACQDDGGMTWRVTDSAASGADKAEVTVTRVIGDDTADVKLSLVRTGGAWRVHDVSTTDVPSYAAHLEQAMAAEG